jgi:ribosomal-protein-alanine N-acetyltransferase
VQFTVRGYRQADFDRLWAIDQSCFPPGIAYSRDELLIYMRRPRAFTLVAESDEEKHNEDGSAILGFVVAESNRRGVGHVITIDVRTTARHQRVGSTLLNSAEQKLCASGCRIVRLEAAVDNLPALTFYKRHGYDVINSIAHYYSNGVDALLLEKDLVSTD